MIRQGSSSVGTAVGGSTAFVGSAAGVAAGLQAGSKNAAITSRQRTVNSDFFMVHSFFASCRKGTESASDVFPEGTSFPSQVAQCISLLGAQIHSPQAGRRGLLARAAPGAQHA